MPLPRATLIETAPGTRVATAGAPTLDILRDPVPNPAIAISAEGAVYEASSTYPGRRRVGAFTDERTGASYQPMAAPSLFDLVRNDVAVLEGKLPTASARGYKLVRDPIRGKPSLTFGLVLCNLAPPPGGSQSQRVLGSAVSSFGQNEIILMALSPTQSISVGGRLELNGATVNSGSLPASPVGKWYAVIATFDYRQNLRVRAELISSDGAQDADTGWVTGPVNAPGVSPAIADQGLVLGGTGGTDGTSNAWDAFRYDGGFHRLDIWAGLPDDTPMTGSTFSRRGLLRERYRSICAVLNR